MFSQTQKLLNVLIDGQEHDVPELIRKVYKLGQPASARLASRIYDLRGKGYEIVSKIKPGTKGKVWKYKLLRKTKLCKSNS